MVEFQLSSGEDFREGIIRIATGLNTDACNHLRRRANIHESVHNARVCFKKIRAVLRLLRSEIGEVAYHAENAFYRDTSRRLSFLRDYTASIEAIEELEKTRRSPETLSLLNSWKRRLQLKRAALLRETRTEELFTGIIEQTEAARARITAWRFEHDAGTIIRRAISRAYGSGKKTKRLLHKSYDDHLMHEWRKDSKYMMYMMQMLRSLWPPVINAFTRELNLLSDYQGRHHDLCVLSGQLSHLKPGKKHHEATIRGIRAGIRNKKKQLTTDALALGSNIYAMKPAEAGNLFREWWKASYSVQKLQS
jgi:hypothetical protein